MTTTALPRPAELTTLPHSGLSVGEFYSMHFMAAMVPLVAGLLLFGWRAGLAVILVCGGTAAGVAVWRRIGPRGVQLSYHHALWFGLLLAMMLPAHLAAGHVPGTEVIPWFLLVAAGLILAMFLWVLGGLGAGRLHPVLVTYLLIAVLSGDLLVPHFVVLPARPPAYPSHSFVVRVGKRTVDVTIRQLTGDLLKGKPPDARFTEQEPFATRYRNGDEDSEMTEPASTALSLYTRGREKPTRGWIPIQSLLRDELPPLEDLIIGGHPSPLGLGSAIAVIIGGLFLLYRGLIDFRIPMIIIIVEFAALLILPIPASLHDQTTWHWLVSRQPGVGWFTGITFANYELMASPVLFMAFFLATSPSIRPMSRRARVLYSVVAGAGSAALQLYIGVAQGPYIALLIASSMTPLLDRWFRARPLV